MTTQGIEAGTGETRSGSIRQDESPSPNGGAPDHPTATDWQNRAYRAEAECKELREGLQARVQPWLLDCFGAEIAGDTLERTDRFIEEALELAQTNPAFTADRAHALVDYVFGRPVGEPSQEVGGVMITLAALCLASGLDMHEAGETELARIWTKVETIRAKQAAKPTGSALPIATNGS